MVQVLMVLTIICPFESSQNPNLIKSNLFICQCATCQIPEFKDFMILDYKMDR